VKTTDKNGKVTKKLRKVVVERGEDDTRIKTVSEKECEGPCEGKKYDIVDGPFTLPPAQDCGILQNSKFNIAIEFDIEKHRALNYPCNKKNARNPYGNPHLIREIRQYLNMEHPTLAGSGCASYCDIKKVNSDGPVEGEKSLAEVVPDWCVEGGRLASLQEKDRRMRV
jgi:hypothetical protein